MIVTSEQVGRGHPDKVCDQISDLILTHILKKDKNARVAIEAALGKNYLFITGEIKSTYIDYRDEIRDLASKLLVSIDEGYESHKIIIDVSKQSKEITKKVEGSIRYNAGDQGLVFGYATNETKSFLPIPFALSSFLTSEYDKIFDYQIDGFGPDSKSQVTYNYKTRKLLNINMSVQHLQDIDLDEVKSKIESFIVIKVREFEEYNNIEIFDDDITRIIVNHGGTFIKGGSFADSGLTGRKIVADTYGGLGRVGGGAFSGKDYTKVDRSGSYFARYVARRIVELKMADICEVQLSFIIGMENPISISVETFDTEKISIEKINEFIDKNFNFSLGSIIDKLDLKNVDYTGTTLYGHFGKKGFKWG